MIIETYKRHLPALAIVAFSIVLWLISLPYLPDPIVVYCSSPQNPVLSSEPMVPFIAMCGFMAVAHIVIVFIDFFLFARVVPGYIMALVDWIVEGFTAVFYLSVLAAAFGILPFVVGLAGGYLAMIVILGVLYRKSIESVEAAATPLYDAPYFERVTPSFLMRVLFFLRALFPRYIVIVPAGIRIIGSLYDVTYPWEQIGVVKDRDFKSFFSNRPVKLNHTLTNGVEVHLKGRYKYVLVSPGEKDRFLKTAAEFMGGS